MNRLLFLLFFVITQYSYGQTCVCKYADATLKKNASFTSYDYVKTSSVSIPEIPSVEFENNLVIDPLGYKYTVKLYGVPTPENVESFNGIKIEYTGFYDKANSKDYNFYTGMTTYLYDEDGWWSKANQQNYTYHFAHQESNNFVKLDLRTTSVLLFRQHRFDVEPGGLYIVLLSHGKAELVYCDMTEIFDCQETTSGYLFKMAKGCMYNDSGDFNPTFVSLWVSKNKDEVWYSDVYPETFE